MQINSTLSRRSAGFAALGALALLLGACSHSGPSVAAGDDTGAMHHITVADLPTPFASQSVNNGQQVIPRPDGAELHTLPGFTVSEWATGLDNPRWMTVAPNGDVFVAESRPGRVLVLRPGKSGEKPVLEHFAAGLRQPFGIAFYPNNANARYVYIADTDEVMRFPYHSGDLHATGPGEKIVALTPGGYNQHWTRTIAVSPDNKTLYIAVGSRENIGEEEPPRACVMTCNPDGSNMHVFATGLRNAVGLSFSPVTGALWAAVNERDGMGDRLPPDYVTSVKRGGFYGWPYYYIGNHHDSRMPERPELGGRVIVPDVLLEAHCAALSVEFDTGHQFPAEYHNDAFVALHGSWNRADPSGYKVVRVPMTAAGAAKGDYQDFVWGWKLGDGRVWGRPVSAVFMRDGSMLVSDDGGNLIWRVSYTGRR